MIRELQPEILINDRLDLHEEGLAYLGLHNINQIWCTDGTCES